MIHYKECPICKLALEVSKGEAVGSERGHREYRSEQYAQNGNDPRVNGDQTLTEVQKNYLREMEEAKKNKGSDAAETSEE